MEIAIIHEKSSSGNLFWDKFTENYDPIVWGHLLAETYSSLL
jgi:hypothetical protein